MTKEEKVIELIYSCTCKECGPIHGYDEHEDTIKKAAKDIIEMKNGVEDEVYYFLLDWKDKNLDAFQLRYDANRLCDFSPQELTTLHKGIILGIEAGKLVNKENDNVYPLQTYTTR